MKIMFVCHGNICRSVMAEYILKSIDINNVFTISSSALSNEEIGHDIFYKAKAVLNKNNIPFNIHHAHKITKDEYDNYDKIFVMEKYQIDEIFNLYYKSDKVQTLLNEDIEDPWYTNNFDKVFNQIYLGCLNIYKNLNK